MAYVSLRLPLVNIRDALGKLSCMQLHAANLNQILKVGKTWEKLLESEGSRKDKPASKATD